MIWSTALAATLLLPVLSFTLPHWNVVWTQSATSYAAPANVAATTTPVDLPPVTTPKANDDVPSQAVAANFAESAKMAMSRYSQAASPARSTSGTPLWMDAIPALWLFGALLTLGRLAAGIRRAYMARRSARPASETMAQILSDAQERIGLRRPVALLTAAAESGVAVPITWGILSPVILLPAQSAEWTRDCVRAALLHELAHIKRFDWATQIVGRVACAVLWFHPLAWIAAWQARDESERACDDCVLRAGVRATDYAQRLVDVIRSIPDNACGGTAAIAMGSPAEIEWRLHAILAPRRSRRSISHKRRIAIMAALISASLPLAALHLQAQPARQPSPKRLAATSAPAGHATKAKIVHDNSDLRDRTFVQDGTRVTLDAVTSFTSSGEAVNWRNAGGVPLKAPLFKWDPSLAKSLNDHRPDEKIVGFAIRLDFRKGDFPPLRWSITTNKGKVERGWAKQVTAAPYRRMWYSLTMVLPASATTCDIFPQLASSPWKTMATWSPQDPTSDRAHGLTWKAFDQARSSQRKDFQSVVYLWSNYADLDQRVVAVNKNGSIDTGNRFMPPSESAFTANTVFGRPMSKIKEFRLEARPFKTHSFMNVPLAPVMQDHVEAS